MLRPFARRRTALKRFFVLCLAGWLAAGAARAQQPETATPPLPRQLQEKLKERDRFWKEAKQLKMEGKLTEAVAPAEKMLAIDREVFGNRADA